MPRGKPFAKGFDARRKLLTTEDRRKGYAAAPSRIRARIRGLYRGGKIVKTGETVYPELADADGYKPDSQHGIPF